MSEQPDTTGQTATGQTATGQTATGQTATGQTATGQASRGHNHPGEVTDLQALADELLPAAREAPARRVARTVTTVGALRVTVIALASGTSLSEHENPGAATLQVLRGSAVLYTDGRDWRLGPGCVVQIPDERHGLRAEEDSVVLLTVALSTPRT